jgi:hypothetical protein
MAFMLDEKITAGVGCSVRRRFCFNPRPFAIFTCRFWTEWYLRLWFPAPSGAVRGWVSWSFIRSHVDHHCRIKTSRAVIQLAASSSRAAPMGNHRGPEERRDGGDHDHLPAPWFCLAAL